MHVSAHPLPDPWQ